MRKLYLVTYDVGNPDRLRCVYRLMRGYGDHVQLSVFLCEMSPKEKAQLRGRVEEIIHMREDQVLFVDLGPVDGRAPGAIQAIGKRYVHPEHLAIIV
jgi:CRISPR-associated protein Cas2